MKKKFKSLSPSLQKFVVPENSTTKKAPLSTAMKGGSRGAVSRFAELTLKHCNGGATLQAAHWLKNHLDYGGKLVITISGALSSFQVGVMLSELIRKNKVHLISATAANHEESFYRYVAHSH